MDVTEIVTELTGKGLHLDTYGGTFGYGRKRNSPRKTGTW